MIEEVIPSKETKKAEKKEEKLPKEIIECHEAGEEAKELEQEAEQLETVRKCTTCLEIFLEGFPKETENVYLHKSQNRAFVMWSRYPFSSQ